MTRATRNTDAGSRSARPMGGPDSNTASSGQERTGSGQFAVAHGGYSIRRLLRLSKPRTKADRRLLLDLRLAWALARGFPAFEAMPVTLRELADMGIDLALHRRQLFSPHWRGEEVPRRHDGVAEVLRRVLNDFGLESRAVANTLQDYVAEKYGRAP